MVNSMDLKSEDYSIQYDEATQTITCQGALRLAELGEYAPLSQLLNSVLEQKFVLKVRQEGTIRMIIQATKSIPWHEKSLKNLQRLMPSLQLEFD
jgi:hypothetical protein